MTTPLDLMPAEPRPSPPSTPDETWRDEIAKYYPTPVTDLVNLEHGYFGAMALPVQAAYERGIRMLNEGLSPFVRGNFTHVHLDEARTGIAQLINATRDEILLTRSASESMQVLIGQYRNLKPGDAVLWSNLDYPAMKSAMQWLRHRRGVTPIELQFDLPISADEILECYRSAVRETGNLKLILMSQIYPANGQRAPIREITKLAKANGIDVLLDCAHALGQLPLDVKELGADFAGFNLHKWIGAPVGIGFTYIRKSKIDCIEPHFGNSDYPPDDIRCRLYAGTPPIGAVLAIPAALKFHEELGGASAKAARLSYLRSYWVDQALDIPGFRLLSPIPADQGTALVAFSIDGISAPSLQERLLREFGVYTVVRTTGRQELVRATVAITTRPAELDRFIGALKAISNEAK